MGSTPLFKKLGIKAHSSVLILNSPKAYLGFFHEFPTEVYITETFNQESFAFIHLFVQNLETLQSLFQPVKDSMTKDGMLWISWPKKTAKIDTEVGKFEIMEYGLNHGLVDTKVAAIDADWSGLKFMYRVKDR